MILKKSREISQLKHDIIGNAVIYATRTLPQLIHPPPKTIAIVCQRLTQLRLLPVGSQLRRLRLMRRLDALRLVLCVAPLG